ncbi:actin-like ATPase domain-containing protein [Meredithblackwellia eburnea MCA 4105]
MKSLAALLLLPLLANAASLLAIDYGTDGFKASLVKPGVPFDVLINKDSKRKTPSLVTMRGEDRSFGAEAASLATRFPQSSYAAIKLLLGHPATHTQALLHQSLFQLPPSTTSRGSPAVGGFSVEEILSMQFSYAKEMAEDVAGEAVREAVVTVPNWFGQSERQAVLDSLDLAGLRALGLVNDGTAAAVNYAMTRTFPPAPSYHLLYDFGSASLRTTVVSLRSALLPDPHSLAAKPELKNVTSLNVHGLGFDTTVGGYVFDRIVRDVMKADFEAKTGKKLDGDKRAMAKLLKEAARVKQVLSANSESSGRIEGLIDDIDLRAVVTREQLEGQAANLVPRFTQPIADALAAANLTIEDLESVILIGGSSRVPMVEAAVRNYVGEDKIAKNVNADEAAVMGAALFGAGLSPGFRTKEIRVQDITPYAIDVSYEADKASEDAEPRRITTHLFPAFSKLGVTKTMTFKKTKDFSIQFSHRKTPLQAAGEQPEFIFETTISGIEKALVNLTEEVIANATVKVTINLSETNIVSVTKAVIVLAEDEPGKPSLNEKLQGFLKGFTGGKKEEGSPGSETPESEDSSAENDTEKEDAKAKLDEIMRAFPTNGTVTLTLNTVPIERNPMSYEDKTEAKKRIREIKAAETRKLAREEARNALEAYIYKVRDLGTQETFIASSIDSERKTIADKTEAANEWLWEEADAASTKDLKAKKSDLEKLVKHVVVRSAEAGQRPKAIDAFRIVLASADTFAASAKVNNTAAEAAKEIPKYTQAEIDGLVKMATETRDWFNAVVKKQEGLKPYEDPVLKVSELEKKARDIDTELTKLRKKKTPRKPRVAASSSSSPKAESTAGSERPKDEL